jgi:hypothetical protein
MQIYKMGRANAPHFEPDDRRRAKKMMVSRILCLVLVALSVVGCTGGGRCGLIGQWKSIPHGTEWGEVVVTLELRSDGECEMRMSPTTEPEGSPLTSRGTWREDGATNATVMWRNDKPGDRVKISLVNATTLTLSGGDDVITFGKSR